MIEIPLPNMSLNSPNLYPFAMQNNRVVATNVTPFWLANNTAVIAAGAEGGKLAALVIHCHGISTVDSVFEGLALGTGIRQKDLKHFKLLKNLVEKIFIVACQPAKGDEGKRFCGELARNTQATVFASDVDQMEYVSDLQAIFKGNKIHDYEGKVFQFGKAGEQIPVELNGKTSW